MDVGNAAAEGFSKYTNTTYTVGTAAAVLGNCY